MALIALVVIGGATRVMEAGLACPDWPLCYGSLLPGRQMNLKVFLEWFHRLDAFVVGIALLVQLGAAWFWRKDLPQWLLPLSFLLVLLVVLQGGLGALTVLQLLPSAVVTAHLVLALTLVIGMSALTQRLLHKGSKRSAAPRWWPLLGGISLAAVSGQCLLGGRMAMGSPTLLTGGSILPMAPLASQCSNPSGPLRFAVRCHSSDRRRLGSSAMASAHHSHPPGLNTDCFGCFHLAAWSESARRDRVSSTRCLSARGRSRGSHLETPVSNRLPSHDRSRFFNPGALSWLVQLPLLQCPHPSQERRWCHLARESNFPPGLRLPNQG